MTASPDHMLRLRVAELACRVQRLENAVFPALAPTPEPERPLASEPDQAESRSIPTRELTGLGQTPSRAAQDGPTQTHRRSSFEIERLIGGKTFAAAGAVAVVVAAGLFLKLAYDQGWLGRIPDGWKCLSAGAFGAALLVAGEIALRRWGRLASAGLTSAGLGVMYAAAFASHAMYSLVSPSGAFGLLFVIVALGVVLGSRAKLAFVATLALAGGYLAPILLRDSAAAPAFLPSYLLALLVTGLVLNARLGPVFTAPRVAALLGTLGLGTLWVYDAGAAHPALAIAFVSACWALVHAETVWACRRDDRSGERHTNAWERAAPRLLTSFTLTAWAISFAILVLDDRGLTTWHAPAIGAALTGALAFTLGRGLAVLRAPVDRASSSLGVALACQCGALLALALAMALSDEALSFAGLALAVASLAAARAIGSRGLRVYGVVALALATARLVFVELAFELTNSGLFTISPWKTIDLGGVVLTRWTVMASLGFLSWTLAAAFTRPGSPSSVRDATRLGFLWIGATLLLLSVVSDEATTRGLSVAWVVIATAYALGAAAMTRLPAQLFASVGVSIAAVAWLSGWPVLRWDEDASAPLLHDALFVALALGAGYAVVRWATRRATILPEIGGGVRAMCAAGVVGVAFIASSAEVARLASLHIEDETAKLASLTLWWAIFASGMIVAGFVRSVPLVRHAGLALLATAAAKAVAIDLSSVEPAWRVASLLGVGLFMLGVAAGYTRVSRAASSKDTTEKERAA